MISNPDVAEFKVNWYNLTNCLVDITCGSN